MRSRALFATRSRDAITLDFTLVRAEEGLDLPPALWPPELPGALTNGLPPGQPFTLQLRAPDAGWFAGRVEELLCEWAEDNRELMLELREDRGRVRTTIVSGDSSVHLELASADGLTQ